MAVSCLKKEKIKSVWERNAYVNMTPVLDRYIGTVV